MGIPTPPQLGEISRLREGTFLEVPFPVLLNALARRERTVILDAERRQMRKTIVFEDGVPVDCRSNLVHETLGRFMVAAGKLSEEEQAACFKDAMARNLSVGQVLLERGLVTPLDLFKLLQQNLAKKLLDLFTWRNGRFRMGFEVPLVDSPLKVRVPQLVLMGITRLTPPEEVNAAVGPLVGKTLALHPAPPFPIDEIRLSARQSRILNPLRQGCRLDELFATGLPPDEISRLVYALAVLGTVAPADELPPPQPAAEPPRPAAPPAAAAASAAPPVPAPAALDALRNEVMQAYLSHRRLDAFDLLGAPEDAPPHAIQERYLDFACRFAPARFEPADLLPLAEKARDLFLAGARAYAELADPEQRQALLSRRKALREAPAPRAAPDFTIKTDLLDPAVQYRKGRELMEAGDFRGAMAQFEFASDCDPGNGLYRAELAHSRYCQSPQHFARPALAELEEALRVDPACGLAAYYAGEIQADLGDLKEAERLLRRSIKLMAPDRRPIEALKTLGKRKR